MEKLLKFALLALVLTLIGCGSSNNAAIAAKKLDVSMIEGGIPDFDEPLDDVVDSKNDSVVTQESQKAGGAKSSDVVQPSDVAQAASESVAQNVEAAQPVPELNIEDAQTAPVANIEAVPAPTYENVKFDEPFVSEAVIPQSERKKTYQLDWLIKNGKFQKKDIEELLKEQNLVLEILSTFARKNVVKWRIEKLKDITTIEIKELKVEKDAKGLVQSVLMGINYHTNISNGSVPKSFTNLEFKIRLSQQRAEVVTLELLPEIKITKKGTKEINTRAAQEDIKRILSKYIVGVYEDFWSIEEKIETEQTDSDKAIKNLVDAGFVWYEGDGKTDKIRKDRIITEFYKIIEFGPRMGTMIVELSCPIYEECRANYNAYDGSFSSSFKAYRYTDGSVTFTKEDRDRLREDFGVMLKTIIEK